MFSEIFGLIKHPRWVALVCPPFQGKLENIEKAKEYCRYVLEKGCTPLASTFISASSWMTATMKTENALEMNKKLMEFYDEFWGIWR